MFNANPTRRPAFRTARMRYAGARKLVIEVVESRLMLSTTTAEQPTELATIPVAVGYDIVKLANTPSNFLMTPEEGGFVSLATDSTTSSGFGMTNWVSLDSAVGRVFSNYFERFPAFSRGLSGSSIVFSSGSDGLQPAAIPMSGEGTGVESNIKPIIAGPPASKPGPDGGSIPIHSLLSDLRREDQLAGGATLRSSSASSAAVAATSTSLSGEWARAVVFEIAGGEPRDGVAKDGDTEHSSHQTDGHLQHDKPLSSNESQSASANLTVNAKGQVAQASAQRGQKPVTQAAAMYQVLADAQHRAGKPDLHGLVNPMSADLGAGAAATSNKASEQVAASTGSDKSETAALAKVFDELGQGSATIVESSARRGTWSRWLAASPLLMILALERIAAVNSRRAARDAQYKAGAQPPRQYPLYPRRARNGD